MIYKKWSLIESAKFFSKDDIDAWEAHMVHQTNKRYGYLQGCKMMMDKSHLN